MRACQWLAAANGFRSTREDRRWRNLQGVRSVFGRPLKNCFGSYTYNGPDRGGRGKSITLRTGIFHLESLWLLPQGGMSIGLTPATGKVYEQGSTTWNLKLPEKLLLLGQ